MTNIPDDFLPDLMELLSIPGVAAWDHGRADLDRAAGWLCRRLERAGLQARMLTDTPGPAYVYAESEMRPERPTLLLYGHYDVQPAALSEGWTSDPFRPELRDARLYARGATDQKMNLLLPIFALQEIGHSAMPWNIKVFFEGEEEILSPNIEAALIRYRDLLRCAVVFSTDGWQASADQGDLRLGLRGFCGLDITVTGATKDLHSGTFGGVAPNPAHALMRALSRLHDANGEIAVPGFFDHACRPGVSERRVLQEQPLDRSAWLGRAGLSDTAIPLDLPIEERAGLHPAIEVNAVQAGRYSNGFRGIVPGSASAHVSCRLVPGQEPATIANLLKHFLDAAIPLNFGRKIEAMPGQSRPYRVRREQPYQQLAASVLATIDGRQPRFSYSGGSIPIPGAIATSLGVDTIIFGFGLPDENMHGVDEFCRLTDIERGMAAWRMLLLAGGNAPQET